MTGRADATGPRPGERSCSPDFWRGRTVLVTGASGTGVPVIQPPPPAGPLDTGTDVKVNVSFNQTVTVGGKEVMIPITAGKLDLGPWEQVFYAEFDGQRKKRVVVKVMGQ